MHLTFAGIVTLVSCGFALFFVIRYRRRRPIRRLVWFGLGASFFVFVAAVSQTQYMFLDEPLVEAAQSGDLAVAEDCLAKGASANADGDDGQGSALVAAASTGHAKIVELLIHNGANVNERSENFAANLTDATPLQAARAYPEITRMLKQAGAKE